MGKLKDYATRASIAAAMIGITSLITLGFLGVTNLVMKGEWQREEEYANRNKEKISQKFSALESQTTSIEEVVARDSIARVFDKEGINYQRGADDKDFGRIDFLVQLKHGKLGIEYGNQNEIRNKDYQKRIDRNMSLNDSSKDIFYFFVPGPLTSEVGKGERTATLENVEWFLKFKGIVSTAKELQ